MKEMCHIIFSAGEANNV